MTKNRKNTRKIFEFPSSTAASLLIRARGKIWYIREKEKKMKEISNTTAQTLQLL